MHKLAFLDGYTHSLSKIAKPTLGIVGDAVENVLTGVSKSDVSKVPFFNSTDEIAALKRQIAENRTREVTEFNDLVKRHDEQLNSRYTAEEALKQKELDMEALRLADIDEYNELVKLHDAQLDKATSEAERAAKEAERAANEELLKTEAQVRYASANETNKTLSEDLNSKTKRLDKSVAANADLEQKASLAEEDTALAKLVGNLKLGGGAILGAGAGVAGSTMINTHNKKKQRLLNQQG